MEGSPLGSRRSVLMPGRAHAEPPSERPGRGKPRGQRQTATTAEASGLTQFLKRVGWREFRENAVDGDEATRTRDAANRVRKALAEKGFAPR